MKKIALLIILFSGFHSSRAQWYWLSPYLYSSQGIVSMDFQQSNLWLVTVDGIIKYDTISGSIDRYNYIDFPQIYYGLFRSVSVDEQGMVYVSYYSEDYGILKYDGVNWSDYPIIGLPGISSWGPPLLKDSQHHLWMLKNNVLARFDGTTWDTFTTNLIYGSSSSHIAIDQSDTIWIASDQGKVLRFYNGIFETVLTGIYASSIIVDSFGNKWIGKYNNLYRLSGNDLDTFNNQNSPINFNPVLMCIDTAGNLVVVKDEDELLFYNGASWTSVNLPAVASAEYFSIICDENNSIWLGDKHSKVYKYENGSLVSYIAGFDLLLEGNIYHITSFEPYLNINALAATEQGLLGIDYQNSAIFLYDSINCPLTTNTITCFAKHRLWTYPEEQWIGTVDGLFKWNLYTNTWKHYTSANSLLPNDTIIDIEKWDNHNGWVATNGGLAKMENDSIVLVFTTGDSPLPSNKIQCMSPVNSFSQPLYIGTDQGVAILENNSWIIKNSGNSGLPDNDITAVLPYNGIAYYGTRDHGVADSIATGWHYHNTSIDLPSDSITFIEEAVMGGTSGTKILIGTKGGGLLTFEGDNYEGAVNEADGIIFSNAIDYSGNTFSFTNLTNWVTTEEGILLHAYVWGSLPQPSSTDIFSAYFQNDELRISYQTLGSQSLVAGLYDLSGRRLLKTKLPATSLQQQVSLRTHALASGLYILTLSEGSQRHVIKVIKLD